MSNNDLRNYVEIKFDENGYLIGKICQNGKYKTIRDLRNVFKLIEIIEKYGYDVSKKQKFVRYSSEMTKEFEKFIKQRRKERIKQKKYKLRRINQSIGAKIAAISLAGVMVGSGLAIYAATLNSNQNNNDNNDTLQGEYIDPDVFAAPVDITDYIDNIEYDEDVENNQKVEEETKSVENDNKDKSSKKIEKEKKSNNEINEMTNEEFHFSYEDRTKNEEVTDVNDYSDIFEKYAEMYGIDVNLLKAMATQETGGNHYDNIDNGPAEGIMQIEKSANIGQTYSAYNQITGEVDSFTVDGESLKDVDYNIKIAAVIANYAMKSFNYNIAQGLQAYNLGTNGMNSVLSACANDTNTTQEALEKSPSNNSWLDYRAYLGIGDPEYVEHVLSYLPNNTTITVKDDQGNNHSIKIVNDYEKEKTHSAY